MESLPLSETVRSLRDRTERLRRLRANAYQSSVFEGAAGLPKPETPQAAPRRKASTKKAVKAA